MSPRQYRARWNAKPVLRAIYGEWYGRVGAACVPGPVLEIGGGCGNFKVEVPAATATDIRFAPWIDVACDAQRLPFAEASFANIVAIDALHHLERPRRFFDQACRVLRPGGRLVMLEPAITPLSWLAYRFFHPEPVRMQADPLEEGPLEKDRDPFDANQAVPTLLFGRKRQRFSASFPQLRLIECRRFSLWVYPLSGGFRSWSLIPTAAVRPMLELERVANAILAPLMAFRMLVVLERESLA